MFIIILQLSMVSQSETFAIYPCLIITYLFFIFYIFGHILARVTVIWGLHTGHAQAYEYGPGGIAFSTYQDLEIETSTVLLKRSFNKLEID